MRKWIAVLLVQSAVLLGLFLYAVQSQDIFLVSLGAFGLGLASGALLLMWFIELRSRNSLTYV